MRRLDVPQNLKRRILKDALRKNEQRDAAFRRIIRSVPKGKVSTYGKVAAAAGYPLYHRAVAKLLQKEPPHSVRGSASLGQVARSNCAERLPQSSAFASTWKV
jgi:methylated-DNA-protein-cysteine methyltransferase related protein